MTSSITVEPYETVEFPDSDTDSWQVVDPCDSDNDDVITTESDVVSSSSDEGDDVDEDEDEDEDVDIADVTASESDVISSDDEDEEEEEDDENEDDDVITSEEEEEEDDVIISEDEEDDVDEITNHTQELNKGYELDGLINGEGGAPYNVEISDAMKEDAYFEHMQLQQRMLDEDDVEEQEDEDEDEDEYDEDLDDELVPRWLNNKFERQRMRKLGKKVYPKMKKSKRMVNQYNRPGCAGAKHGLGLNNNLVW